MLTKLRDQLSALSPDSENYALAFVDLLLASARTLQASDLHLQPLADALDVRLRLDGVLQPVGQFVRGTKTDIVSRLKVLAQLLTYRMDIPQEGRLPGTSGTSDARVCTFPTVFGERAVVRFFAAPSRYLFPEDLGLPEDVQPRLVEWLAQTSGLVIVTGPAGAGKSTTLYAAARHIARLTQGQRSIVSLEDPVEVVVPEVAQCQVNPTVDLDLASGLRALLRQDPEVILVGEIRDRPTSEIAFQAALTGHLILSTFHAGSVAEGIGRLLDMGLEPYVIRSGLKGMTSQRLLRRLCSCARPTANSAERCGLDFSTAQTAVGCTQCNQSGYQGRCLIAETLPPLLGELGRGVLERRDAQQLQKLAESAGMIPLAKRAKHLVQDGQVSPLEMRRVLGSC